MRLREFRLVIEKDGVKRALSGPFRVCLSRETAERLIDQLVPALNRDASYGWLTVMPEIVDESPPDTPPREWTD